MTDYIKKINLDDDAFYIDISCADVRILCTSPAEIVKCMKKKQTILSSSNALETGPNVILLSEHNIRRSYFRNLIEFPILQMIYNQGLVDDNKPILLASSYFQLYPLIEYVDTGLCGIVDIKELKNSGLGDREAVNFLNMKLQFFGGKFKFFTDMIDVLFLKHDKYIPIKNGVSIARLGSDKYKIEYAGQVCDVDLNEFTQKKDKPYPLLEYKRTDLSDYFSVVHTGEGDGWNPNFPSMSSMINFNGDLYLVDVPPNINFILARLGIGIDHIAGIFQTHVHDDHFAGILSFLKGNRNIKYISTELVRKNTIKKLSILHCANYLHNFAEVIDLKLDTWNDINGLQVKPFLSAHPVETTCLSFRAMDDDIEEYKSYTHLADISSFGFLDRISNCNNIDSGFIEKMKLNYKQPSFLKKIDVGGGLIHGANKDFKDDKSNIIRYSHLGEHHDLKSDLIAKVGDVDVVIEGKKDYSHIKNFNRIKSFFDFLTDEQIETILSTKQTFKSGDIIIEKCSEKSNILMVMSGVVFVENIDKSSNLNRFALSGFLIGKYEYFSARYTRNYLASTYVDAVVIPRDVISQKYSSMSRDFHDNENFLYRYCRFKDYLDIQTSFKMAQSMSQVKINKGSVLSRDFFVKNSYLIKSGDVDIKVFGVVLDTIGKGKFIYHEQHSPHKEQYYNIVLKTDMVLYSISNEIMDKLPFHSFVSFSRYVKYFERTINIMIEKQLFINNLDFIRNYKSSHKITRIVNIINILFYLVKYYSVDSNAISFYIQKLSKYYLDSELDDGNLSIRNKIINIEHSEYLDCNLILDVLNEIKSSKIKTI